MERKRHYRRLDQLRELLISHGVELLLESDPDDRDAVTFNRVFARVEAAGHPRVTKGSVLGPGRAWASQRQFQQDVEAAAALALGDIDLELNATLQAATGVLETADLSTRASRARAAQQLCRHAAAAYFTQLTESKSWRLWVGLWGRLAASGSVGDEGGLGTSLRQAQLGSLRRLVDQLYGPLAQVIGYRGRPEFGSDEQALAMLAVAALGITDGLAIHERLFPEHFEPVPRPTGPNGATELWHPFAVAFEALVNQYLEPAPARPAAPGARGVTPASPLKKAPPRKAAAPSKKAAARRKAAPTNTVAATRRAAPTKKATAAKKATATAASKARVTKKATATAASKARVTKKAAPSTKAAATKKATAAKKAAASQKARRP